MALDLYSLKNILISKIRSYVYPVQLDYGGSVSLKEYGQLEQQFYPFSSSIGALAIYCSSTVGPVSPSSVQILSNGTIYSGSVVFSPGWNTLNVNREVASNMPHTIRVYGGTGPDSDIFLGVSSVDNAYFYGTLPNGRQLAFSVGVRDFVFNVYPLFSRVALSSLPIVVADITSRPGVADVYVSGDALLEILQLSVEVYSRYPDEIDKIAYGVERGLVRDRKTFGSNVRRITPVAMSGLGFISPEIFFRTLRSNLEVWAWRT